MKSPPGSKRKPMLEIDHTKHEYRYGGAVVPSVTEIIRPLYSFDGVPDEVLERKRLLGENLHSCIQLDLENDLDEESVPPACVPYFRAWRRFREETGFEAELVERPVFHSKLRYAGTPDARGWFTKLPKQKGKRALMDWKATYTLSPIVRIQTAAYAAACQDGGEEIDARFGVQFRLDGSYAMEQYLDKTDFPIFQNLLNLYNWKERNL